MITLFKIAHCAGLAGVIKGKGSGFAFNIYMKQDRLWAGLMLAVLAFFGLSAQPEKAQEPAADSKAGASKSSPEQEKDPKKRESLSPDEARKLIIEAMGTNVQGCGCDDPQVLIATVPDPKRSGIPALLDSAIESIQRAAAESDYSLRKADAGKLVPGNPGMLWFQTRDGRVLLVLLVGESPISGIDRKALRAALIIHDAIRSPVQPECEVRVLGPTFSGSAGALSEELSFSKAKSIEVVSGTATGSGNKQYFTGHIKYRSAAENDGVTLQSFLEFLAKRGIPPERVAMLAEAGTAFGRAFVEDKGEGRRPGLAAEFPMQISRLRAAYQNNPTLRALWRPNTDAAPGLKLNAPLEVAENERPGAFAKDQTAMEMELGVAELATEITRSGIEAAIIAASDEGDILFLSKMLQRLSPNVRLATLDADLLYLHTTPELSYAGMMMVTPYPLWLPNQPMQAGANTRKLQPFTSRAAVGVFNAARILLEDRPAKRKLIEFGHPLHARAYPPVWVTMVGGGDIWPLAILDQNLLDSSKFPSTLAEAAGPNAPAPPPIPVTPPRSGWFTFLFSITCLLSIWAIANYVCFAWRRPTIPSPFELPDAKSFDRTLLYGVLVGSGLVIVGHFLVVLASPHAGNDAAVRLMYLAAWALPLSCILLGFLECDRQLIWLTLVLSAAAAAFFALSYVNLIKDESNGLAFVARALNPYSGVDPLSPQTFVWFGLVWWAALSLHRMRMAELRNPGNPFAADAKEGLGKAFDDLLEWLNDAKWKEMLPFTALSLACLILPAGARWTHALEPLTWQASFTAGFVCLWILCTTATLRMVFIMARLSDALRPLPWNDLADAFGRLDKDIALSDMWRRGSRRFPLEGVNYSIDLLRKIAAIPGQTSASVRLGAAKELLEACRDQGRRNQRLSPDKTKALHENLTAFGRECAVHIGLGSGPEMNHEDPELKKLEEEYVALRIISLVWYSILHMRLLLEFLTVAVVALFLAILSYPFEPHTALTNAVTGLTVLCGGAALFVFHQLDHNEILNKLRPGGKSSWAESFYAKALLYGLVPLSAALANRFPGTLRKLGELIEPLTKLAAG